MAKRKFSPKRLYKLARGLLFLWAFLFILFPTGNIVSYYLLNCPEKIEIYDRRVKSFENEASAYCKRYNENVRKYCAKAEYDEELLSLLGEPLGKILKKASYQDCLKYGLRDESGYFCEELYEKSGVKEPSFPSECPNLKVRKVEMLALAFLGIVPLVLFYTSRLLLLYLFPKAKRGKVL